jgi:D-alanyl-D-alanine carboxypeptidase
MKITAAAILLLVLSIISISFLQFNKKALMETEHEVASMLQQIIDGDKSPSLQYLIFDKNSILYKYQNGWQDVGNHKKIDDRTTYNVYSVTKTFTALAVLQLAEQGKLEIDEPVLRYLPDFPYGSEITVRNLLTHSSGIPNPIPLSWIHLAEDHEEFNNKAFGNLVISENAKTKFPPNEKYAYSNIGYIVLGRLIEAVSGLTYEAYMNEHILDKLGENKLTFTIKNFENHARGYQKRWSFTNMLLGFFLDKSRYMDKPEGQWKPFKPFYVNDPAYGGLIGTSDGFIAYIRELLNDDGALLSSEYKKMLFTENILVVGSPSGMCLSWFPGSLEGNQYFNHAGGGGGYYVEIRVYPKLGLGSVIMFNRSGMSDERFLDKVDRHFVLNYMKRFNNPLPTIRELNHES